MDVIPVRFADEGEGGIDAAAIKTKEELLLAIGVAMQLPDYFDPNWDSFEECLRDFPGELTIRSAESLWQRLPRECGMLTEIFQSLAIEEEPVSLIFVW